MWAKDKSWGPSGYLGGAWVQPQVKAFAFLLRYSPVPRWSRCGLSCAGRAAHTYFSVEPSLAPPLVS